MRLIVDTGLHYTGMKRDEAIKMFADNAWDDSDFTRKEVGSVLLLSEKDSVNIDCLCASKQFVPLCKMCDFPYPTYEMTKHFDTLFRRNH